MYRGEASSEGLNIVSTTDDEVIVQKKDDVEATTLSDSTCQNDSSPALSVLVVRVSTFERIMGPLVDFLRRHPVAHQAKVFSRLVC